ncbi:MULTISPECIES: restriction endonuclease subunit S [Enterobacter cloacae complex]|uniref:restriction endonuclease subunit S n=1 Tax=Enterobacter cloacae complex TaxID=354276 RepID=UPI00100F6606|nr:MULTISPECIES: restriction endonuclease subunit S [Enterobacter cloacae complex]MCE1514897.1 restriction endonuclease subunit S [Enterobacter hormaechei]MCU4096175.1 restriction endonuclease subunit S [Enterobacter hormaechei subsp. steigerwaltii]RYA68590.1 restriction endonuclease subunit S [Enterobacter cloacae complex sp. 2DZ2F16B1]HDH1767603.1 restriction endonuclease subunit S [Klebsiella quasipneumoniae subsp. similipneumoniae]MCK2174557.1 restriction endonuclease subunit S [Enterobact
MTGNQKYSLVPQLRFPEFRNAGEWFTIELGEISQFVTERAGTTICTPYTITSGVGLISQEEKLGRTIAGNSLKNYIVLQKNDFAYNKSATKAYPQGFIACYLGDDRAAVPNSIFTCFRVNKKLVIPAFLDALFFNNLHGNWLRNRIAIGARAHGSLQVNDDDIRAIPVPLPSGSLSLAEQQKIADCLSSLDELITEESLKLDRLNTHKNGLMQQLFPRKGESIARLRFPKFQKDPEWRQVLLGDLCHMQAGKFIAAADLSEEFSDGLYPCYGGNGLRGYAKKFNRSGRFSLIGRQGALCGNVNLVDGNFYATEHAVVTMPKPGVSTDWLYYCLKFLNLNTYATGQAQPGLSIESLEKVPCVIPQDKDQEEQQKIADCLSSVDDLIAAQSHKVYLLKTWKKGLMQKLFPKFAEVCI